MKMRVAETRWKGLLPTVNPSPIIQVSPHVKNLHLGSYRKDGLPLISSLHTSPGAGLPQIQCNRISRRKLT